MTLPHFKDSLAADAPPPGLPAPLLALWWEAKGQWGKAHALISELDTKQAMAVHAYLHRREGDRGNAGYWDRRAGSTPRHATLEAEWATLAHDLLTSTQA